MAPKGNNMVPNGHFHKDWQRYVKTWFNQPARKKRRHDTRLKKARRIAPRPAAGPLRPIIRCPTFKYNSKRRLGKGFSFEELKAVNVSWKEAMGIGIAVDFRRKNKSVESLQENVQRLKEYKSKLILFPKSKKKVRQGEASSEETKMATQLQGKLMPLKTSFKPEKARAITAAEKKASVYDQIVRARKQERFVGILNKIRKRKYARSMVRKAKKDGTYKKDDKGKGTKVAKRK
ncbi:60S ribosomal protein L13 [Patella vulgata]|uniref:60S ribosomal protein L13 n=1 Tax=Patella vulgata TaxID=6465 RepID=UPI00217F74E9|nr:60S ribosomal protein L13 [Patella vulgata]